MSYALPFVKVNIEGCFGVNAAANVEQWTAGYHVIKNGGMSATPTELTAYLTAVLPLWSTFMTTSNNSWGSNTWLTGASAALIGVDGHYANGSLQPTTRVALGTPVAGLGTPSAPWSQSIVFSLRSLTLRGPGSHGRFYWPFTQGQVTAASGLIGASQVGNWATNAQTLINGINGLNVTNFGTNTYVGLVSNKGTGFQSPVAQVWVGAKVDHMESREHKLSETYVVRSLTVSAALIAERDREIRDRLDEQDRERADADVD